jgi:GH24 family phage-related lysozyme (muramidase)
MLSFSNDRLEIIKKYEGFRSKTYDDATGKSIDSLEGLQGTMLVGYGTANCVPLGIVFPAGFTIGEEHALRWLFRVVSQKADMVNKRFRDIELNQNQFDAIVMLCYNVGEGCLKLSLIHI